MNAPSPDRPPILRKIDRTDLEIADFTAADQLTLAADGVALWLVDLNTVATNQARWHNLLSADERERAARFHFERDRKNFTATRGLLRIVLGGYLAMPPERVAFTYAEKGKPAAAKIISGTSEINFNVSHSGDAALFGFTRKSHIGVDIEKIRLDFDMLAIARRFFSEKEQTELAALPAERQSQAFFRTWTLKESFIKALGEGLSHPLDQFDVSVTSDLPATLVTRPNAQDAANWELQTIDLGEEIGKRYTAAFTASRR